MALDQDRKKALQRFTWAVKPILKCLLITFRIPYPLIERALKQVTVEIANDHIAAKSGSEPEIAQIALLTGLSPSTLNSVRLNDSRNLRRSKYWAPEASIIDDWTAKPEWTDEEGNPLVLPISGSYGDKNFPTLVRKCLGSIGHRHILNRLENAKCVTLTMLVGDGRPKNAVKLTKKSFSQPVGNAIDVFIQSLESLYHLSTTIAYNSSTSHRPPNERHFQQVVASKRIPPHKLDELRQGAKSALQLVLNSIASKMQPLEEKSKTDDFSEYPSIGVNLSYFEDKEIESEKHQ